MNQTIFYILGISLVVAALVIGLGGMRMGEPPKIVLVGGLVGVAALVAVTATFAVLSSQDEQNDRQAEQAKAAAESAGGGTSATEAPKPGGDAGGAAAVAGPGGTLDLAADPTDLAYDKTVLESAPGAVTINFDNPSQISHNVVISDADGMDLGESDLIANDSTSVTAELAPGDYTFFCSVPGHADAGMTGTLTVK